ncbi:MAG: SDR family oxidoreductase [Pirellulaceae bacterium]|nr:SDR family oxidoreductase [Pirellulaceae bacterium]
MTSSAPAYLILGGSGGIGSACARQLRAAGSQVMLAGRNEAALKALAAELDCPWQCADARSIAQVEHCVQSAAQQFDTLDGVANCVGSVLLKPAHLTTPAEWDETLAVNLTSAFAVVRAASRVMRERGGAIVLVSSAAARLGLANHEAIAAAKAGVAGLALSAAATYAARNIRVNAVAPGLVRTELTRRIWDNQRAAEASVGMHALGRLGEPDDVARLIVWLLAPENSWITGQVYGVDGGLATVRTQRPAVAGGSQSSPS